MGYKTLDFLFISIILQTMLAFPSLATPTTAGLSLFETPKYKSDFTHFDYTSPEAVKGGEMRLAAPGTFDSLNPYIITGTAGMGAQFVFPTLMVKSGDEQFTIYPYVAESYDLAPDRSFIIFNIRPQATFHDGSPITPDDIIFSFETLIAKGNPIFKNLFIDVKKVEKIGKTSVKFTFGPKPNRELPLILGTNIPLFSKAYYANHDFSKPTLLPPLGAGPYRFDHIEPGRSITLTRIKNWWGENLPVNRYAYNFDTIRIDYFRDPNVAFEAFKLAEIDFRQEISAKFWATGYTFPAFKEGLVIRREVDHQIPLGMTGFIFNTRRPYLKDPRVREALGYAFDFEWINKNIFHGSYARLKSYFSNSPFGSTGLPSPAELKILAPYKDKLPERLFQESFALPTTDASGNIRSNIKKAQALFQQAGYIIKNGKLINDATNEPLKLEIISNSPMIEKVALSLVKNLKAMGVEASFRLLDSSQYTERTNSFDFDIVAGAVLPQSNNPGNEQRDYWGSASANIPGSLNLAGISDPIVDKLVESIIESPDYETLLERTHALDRVLLWGFYVIPKWSMTKFRIAYWNKFGYPKISPLYDPGIETWWIDPNLEVNLQKKLKK